MTAQFAMPRALMPQILEADYPAFMQFAAAQGVKILSCNLPVALLRGHQNVDPAIVAGLSAETLAKALLTSQDNYILDGHHRHAGHIARGDSVCACDVVELDWLEAIEFMFSFPKTFAYGDGNYHPNIV